MLKDKKKYNAYHNEYMKQRYQDVNEFLSLYKTEVGCKDCGYNAHHAGLQFDHIIPRNGNKNKRISAMACRGIAAVMKHIEAECEVVCSTCHSVRTWERQQTANSIA